MTGLDPEVDVMDIPSVKHVPRAPRVGMVGVAEPMATEVPTTGAANSSVVKSYRIRLMLVACGQTVYVQPDNAVEDA